MTGELSRLEAPKGANRNRKTKGRGQAHGQGKTAGRGMKGQKARKSGQVRIGFEGGQMPIQRRMPKRGFTNPFTQVWAEIRLRDLNRFEDGAAVDRAALRKIGLAKETADGVKIISTGELDRKVHVTVNRITASAKKAIEDKGGSVKLIADREKWLRADSRVKRRASKQKPKAV